MAHLFDETELLERIDNDWEFLNDTVEMLAEDGPALVQEIRQAALTGDAATVSRAAHALKGMIANFCAPAPQATALEVERMGKAGDLGAAPTAIDTLATQLHALTCELRALVAGRV
jgi:HPt (histidine-containing phosphotransfer) domain-containing protein